ncbi:unnamed protein product [Cunninghamella blakesleeana]
MDKEDDYNSTSLNMTATFDSSTRKYYYRQQQLSTNTLNSSNRLSENSQRINEPYDNDNFIDSFSSLVTTASSNNNSSQQPNDLLKDSEINNISLSYDKYDNHHHSIKDKKSITNKEYCTLKGKQPQSQKKIDNDVVKTIDNLFLEMENSDDIVFGNSKEDEEGDIVSSKIKDSKDRVGINHIFDKTTKSKLIHDNKLLTTIEESVEDLLLEMEDNDDINDSENDNDVENICNSYSIVKNTSALSKSTNLKNDSDQLCTSVDDLLVAMESEEIAMDDYDDSKEEVEEMELRYDIKSDAQINSMNCHGSSFSAAIKTPAMKKSKHRDIGTSKNVYTGYNQNTDEGNSQLSYASKRRKITSNESIPKIIQNKDRDSVPMPKCDKWRCIFCKFVNNMDQEICAICRYKPKNRHEMIEIDSGNSSLKNSLLQQSTISPSIDTSSVFIPATIQILAPQTQASHYINQPICIMSTALNKMDSASIDSSITKVIDLNLKLEICSNIKDIDQVTHLITSINSDGLCARTSKYLLSIITGKWIVDTSWLLSSIQAGYWLPEQDYEVCGDKTLGCTYGPKHGRERDSDQPFFHERQFFFYGDYPSEEKLLLMQLITVGGGTVHSRRPPEKKKDIVIIIIPSNDILLKKNKSIAWLHQCKYVKNRHWLIETVARGKALDL